MLQKMKKIRSGLLALFIAAAMMIPTGTAFTQTAYAEDDYILIIGSKQVTAENAEDVLGDGTVSFEYDSGSDSGTLTLNNARITETNYYNSVRPRNIYSEGMDLTIVLESGTSVIGAANDVALESIAVDGNLTINGDGKLKVTGDNFAIYDPSGWHTTTIESGEIEATGTYSPPICAGNINVTGGKVIGSSTYIHGVFYAYHNISISGGSITATSVGGNPTILAWRDIAITGGEVSATNSSGNAAILAVGTNSKIEIDEELYKEKPEGGVVADYDGGKAVCDAENNVASQVIIKKKPEPKPEPTPSPEPSKEAAEPLMAKMSAGGAGSMVISWNKIDGAEGYDIFFSRCGSKSKKKLVKTVSGDQLKWTKKGLSRKRSYKAVVKAYVMKDGKKTYIGKSPEVHAYTSGGTKKYTNAKSVSVKKSSVSLGRGKTYKVKATVNKLKKGKKLLPHVSKLRYVSSDTKVATVSKNGKITAKGSGSCFVYVFAHNGAYKKIKITVN